MQRIVIRLAGLVAIAPLSWLVNPGTSLAATPSRLVAPSKSDETQIAQFFYPPADARTQGISVMGYGTATAPADTAKLQLFFVGAQSSSPSPNPFPTSTGTPLTAEQLQPVVDALVAAGVSADAIELGTASTQAFVFFNIPGQQLTITLAQPTSAQVQSLIELAQETAAENDTAALVNTSVQYSINDCQSLAGEAYTVAIADAQSRARAIATQLGVELAAVPSIAESPFSLLTFTPGSTCDAPPSISLPFNFNVTQSAPNLGAPAEVQLRRDLFVTFPIQD